MQRVAMVTGATRGIGSAIALKLAKEGYAVVVSGTREQGAQSQTMQDLQQMGVPCMYVALQLDNPQSRKAALDAVYEKFGRLDVLVNNAGMAPRERRDLLDMSEESFAELMAVNLQGPFMLTQDAANRMRKQPQAQVPACIVVVSSISAFVSSVNRGEYCVSKAGLSMMVKLFADRLAQDNIRVYEVQPGIIKTDMTQGVQEKYDTLIAGGLTPIKRWGYPEDVANAVAGLCSGAFAFSTGEVVRVDGGFHIQRL